MRWHALARSHRYNAANMHFGISHPSAWSMITSSFTEICSASNDKPALRNRLGAPGTLVRLISAQKIPMAVAGFASVPDAFRKQKTPKAEVIVLGIGSTEVAVQL